MAQLVERRPSTCEAQSSNTSTTKKKKKKKKKKEILSFAGKQLELENIILSEVS
jgi:hypothetical protein